MASIMADAEVLAALTDEQFATQRRAAEQFVAAASRSLADFTVAVLMLPPFTPLHLVARRAAQVGLGKRSREIARDLAAADRLAAAFDKESARRSR